MIYFMFFWIDASVNEPAAVNPNGIKTLLVNGMSMFFITLSFINEPRESSEKSSSLIYNRFSSFFFQ